MTSQHYQAELGNEKIPDLTDLINLQALGLSHNQLTGTIPNLTTLTHLEELFLGHNQLSGSIPQELGILTNLERIHLSNNQLTGMVPDLTLLSNLRQFDVSNNQLTGSLPEFDFAEFLWLIEVQNNQFCGEIPASLLAATHAQRKRGEHTYVNNNHLTTSNPSIIAFLDEEDPSWAATQTPMDCSEPLPVNTVTVLSADGQTYLTLEVKGCDVQNVKVKTEIEASQGIPDGAYDFPQGLIEFELPSCEQAEVTVYYHGITDVSDRVYRKYGPTTPGDDSTIDWYTLPATFATRTIGGQPVATASFVLQDNHLGDDTGKDNLIVDIGGAAKTTCLIYGLHDDGLNNTHLFTINPTQYFEVTPLGEPYAAYDIEALDMNSKGDIYASSGDDAKRDNPNGHLYQVERSQGQITSVGDICFIFEDDKICGAEVSALTFHPDDSLWAWAEDYGLVIVNLTAPDESALTAASDLPIEDLTWNDRGEILYGIANREIWRYDTSGLQKACTLAGEVEVLESLPDNLRMTFGKPEGHDLLMYSYGSSEDVTIRALDANTCEDVREISIYAPDYYDIEGVVWACDP